MDGCRTPLLQRGIDAAAHHADCIEHDPGDSGSNCVTGGELRNDTTEFPPLDGTLPNCHARYPRYAKLIHSCGRLLVWVFGSPSPTIAA